MASVICTRATVRKVRRACPANQWRMPTGGFLYYQQGDAIFCLHNTGAGKFTVLTVLSEKAVRQRANRK